MTNLSGEEVFLPTIVAKTSRSQCFQASTSFDDRSQIAAFWTQETKKLMAMYITTKLNSTFGEQLVKPQALKWQQKRWAKTQALALA